MNITEDYVSFEVAKLLKEKGFDEKTLSYYEDNVLCRGDWFEWNRSPLGHVAAPTLQMAMKWLREVHNVFIYIEPFITTSGLQGYKPYCTKIGGEFMWINPLRKYSNTSSDTYEDAVEAALKYSLENLIK
jgi:hypothetical protein